MCMIHVCIYSAAHEQLDSPRVSHASTRTRTRVYLHEYTRVLAHAHVGTRKRTHSRSNACTRPGYRRHRYAFTCTTCARYSCAHACDTHCTCMRANIHTRVDTRGPTDRQVARERHCTCTYVCVLSETCLINPVCTSTIL